MDTRPSIAMSAWARDRHQWGKGRAFFNGSEETLLTMVRDNWGQAKPGQGETGLDRKIVVPVSPKQFRSGYVTVTDDLQLTAFVDRRGPKEEPHVRVLAVSSKVEEVKFADVVLYSAAALLENGGERSSEADWEIVALLASDVADEPMNPLTMARNQLALPGGTQSQYSAEEFARAIIYWSKRVSAAEK